MPLKATANYHTHTMRCNHAVGEDRAYVEAAIRAGYSTLGFSDHIPWGKAVPYAFVRTVRMPMEQADEYVGSIRDLAKEYEKDIHILVGFEAEYLPMFFEEQMEMADRLRIDYLILGQHNLQKYRMGYVGSKTRKPAVLENYVDTVIEAMRTGRYLYLAHPDVMHFVGKNEIWHTQMERLCREMKALDIPLEINQLGIGTKRYYPSGKFFRIAAEVGNDVILGVDAHDPAQLLDESARQSGLALAQKFGLHVRNEMDITCRR